MAKFLIIGLIFKLGPKALSSKNFKARTILRKIQTGENHVPQVLSKVFVFFTYSSPYSFQHSAVQCILKSLLMLAARVNESFRTF